MQSVCPAPTQYRQGRGLCQVGSLWMKSWFIWHTASFKTWLKWFFWKSPHIFLFYWHPNVYPLPLWLSDTNLFHRPPPSLSSFLLPSIYLSKHQSSVPLPLPLGGNFWRQDPGVINIVNLHYTWHVAEIMRLNELYGSEKVGHSCAHFEDLLWMITVCRALYWMLGITENNDEWLLISQTS